MKRQRQIISRRRRGSRQGTPYATLRLGVVEVHPANTPPRLFQLLSSRDGGAVVWEETAAEALQVDKGWSVEARELDAAEAAYLSRYAGRPIRAGDLAFLARCDGILTKTEAGTIVCGRPEGLDTERISVGDVSRENFAPIGQFVGRSDVQSVVAFFDAGLPGVGETSPEIMGRANKAMQIYRRIEDFFRLYAECASAFGRDFAPEQEEMNRTLMMRDTLARLAQPVYVLREHFNSGDRRIADSRLGFPVKVSGVSAVLLAAGVNVALWLLSYFLPELERVDAWVEWVRDSLCRRIYKLAGVNKRAGRLTPDQAKLVACIKKLGCEDPNPTPWGRLSLAGLAVVGGAYYYRRRLK